MITPDQVLLNGQVALITGGGAGIGAGIAHGLACFGADVVLADIDADAAEETARTIREMGRQAVAVTTDVSDPAQIRAAVERAHGQFRRLDILVNNAAGVRRSAFLDMSERSRERHLAINLTNLFTATDAAVRVMREGGRGGSIINIASIEGTRAAPNFSVYAACKAAMLNFTQSMALELAGFAIRVNAIIPDFVDTPGMRRMGADAPVFRESRERYIPLGRDGTLDDCAGAAVFLCSPLASYITGAALNVDGGTSAASGWVRDRDGAWVLSN